MLVLVTCWTQRPEDEHRLLSSLLAAFLKYETVPREVLPGTLADAPHNTFISIALPPPKDRSLADVWSALGGELKPSLDLVVTAPFDAGRVAAAGPPVLEEPRIAVASTNGDGPETGDEPKAKKGGRKTKKGEAEEPEEPPVAQESFTKGNEDAPGRSFSIRDTRG